MNTGIIKKICYAALPLLSICGELLYLSVLYVINYSFELHFAVMFVLFLPIIWYERLICIRIDKLNLKSGTGKVTYFVRVFFWLFVYLLFLIIHHAPEASPLFSDYQLRMFLGYPLSYHISLVIMTVMAQPLLGIIFLIIWVLAYFFVVMHKRRFKLLICIVFPAACIIFMENSFYKNGGMGKCTDEEISAQPGVEIFYGPENFSRIQDKNYRLWNEHLRHHPRDIFLDRRRGLLYAVYAATIGREVKQKVPYLLSIDIASKDLRYFLNYPGRKIILTENSVLAAPWFKKKILELDPVNLKIIREIPLKYEVYPYKVRDMLYDRERGLIYITYDMDSILQVYEYSSGRMLEEKEFSEFSNGNTIELWRIALSKTEDKIYMIIQAAPGADIIVLDRRDLSIYSVLDLKVFAQGTMLYLDDPGGRIFFQDGLSRTIFEINSKSLKTVKKLHGELQSHKVCVDRKRNCLYVLSYFYGRMSCVDLATGKRKWRVKVGGKPYGIVLEGDFLYVNSAAGIVRVDISAVNNDPRN
jgi:hypothetical protein